MAAPASSVSPSAAADPIDSREPTPAPYVSARPLARGILALVGVQAVVRSVRVEPALDFDALSLRSYLARGDLLGEAGWLAFVACFVVFGVWVYRATRNLPALGTTRPTYSPWKAVTMLLIPILNELYTPYAVMSSLWRESQPRDPDRPRRARVPLVAMWWLSFLAFQYRGVNSVGWLRLVCVSIDLGACALFAAVVWRLQARQDAQWLDLERRRGVPQPTAQALR